MTGAPRAEPPRLAELPLVLATPRLRLRPIDEADVEGLWPHVTDPEVPRWMSWRPHADRQETLAYVRSEARALADNHGIVWVLEEAGRTVGTIGLRRVQWHTRAWRVDRAELGYWLAPAAWNRGLMTEAGSAVVGFAFDAIGLHKLTSGCLAENTSSRRVLEKLGFRAIGVHQREAWVDGAWRDHLAYELLAEAWRAGRPC